MKQVKQTDLDFEIGFYEGLLEKRHDFLQNLIMLGELYTRKGLYQKGLEIDKKLAKMRPEDPVILYNLACSYSLLSQIDHSFAALKLAVQCGYDEIDHLEQDEDLNNLKQDPRFPAYLAQIKSPNLKNSLSPQ